MNVKLWQILIYLQWIQKMSKKKKFIFYECKQLKNLDFSHFDIGKVKEKGVFSMALIMKRVLNYLMQIKKEI